MNLLNKNTRNFFLITGLICSLGAFAHEGHDHGVPGVLKPQKGGSIKPALGGLLIELVADKTKKQIKLYPMNKEYKAVALNDVSLNATTLRRRVDKKPTELKLEAASDHLVGNFDPQGKYPFNVDITTNYKNEKDSVSFIVDRN